METEGSGSDHSLTISLLANHTRSQLCRMCSAFRHSWHPQSQVSDLRYCTDNCTLCKFSSGSVSHSLYSLWTSLLKGSCSKQMCLHKDGQEETCVLSCKWLARDFWCFSGNSLMLDLAELLCQQLCKMLSQAVSQSSSCTHLHGAPSFLPSSCSFALCLSLILQRHLKNVLSVLERGIVSISVFLPSTSGSQF